jgi:MFS family permease
VSATPPAQGLAQYQTAGRRFYVNLSDDTLIISEDRVRLLLVVHLQRMGARERWLSLAGILATIAATLATTTFRDFILDAHTWRAVFLVAGALAFAWLLINLGRLRNVPSVDQLVTKMKELRRGV